MEGRKYRILLCEDDTNLGMVLKNYLEWQKNGDVYRTENSQETEKYLWENMINDFIKNIR